MATKPTYGMATLGIHGSSQKDAHGSPHTPIYNTTTFAFPSTAALLDVADGRKRGALYTRYGQNNASSGQRMNQSTIERNDLSIMSNMKTAIQSAVTELKAVQWPSRFQQEQAQSMLEFAPLLTAYMERRFAEKKANN